MKAVVRLNAGSILLATVALGLAASAARSQEPVPPRALEVRLEAPRARVGATDPLVVKFTLRNTSAVPVTVLKWHTPLDGFTGDLFEVTQEGAPVRYIGPIVKRAEPQPEDYVTLEPGAEVSADVDLAEGYAIADPGRYTVAYRLSLGDALTGRTAEGRSPKERLRLRGPRSNAVTIDLAEPRAHRPPVGARRPPADPGAPRAGALGQGPGLPELLGDPAEPAPGGPHGGLAARDRGRAGARRDAGGRAAGRRPLPFLVRSVRRRPDTPRPSATSSRSGASLPTRRSPSTARASRSTRARTRTSSPGMPTPFTCATPSGRRRSSARTRRAAPSSTRPATSTWWPAPTTTPTDR